MDTAAIIQRLAGEPPPLSEAGFVAWVGQRVA
jgi:hypothetical protein